MNRLYSHVVEGRARPETSNNRLSENDDCTCDEQFERDTKKAMKLSLMSMKNESVMTGRVLWMPAFYYLARN